MPAGCTLRNIGRVLDFIRDRMVTAAVAGLVATLAVGVLVALGQIADSDSFGVGVMWWIAYGAFALAFTYDALTSRRHQWRHGKPLVIIEAAAASLTYLASPDLGWTGVLMVVSAASGAYVLSPVAIAGVVAIQTAVAGVGPLLVDGSTVDAGLSMVAFGAFQSFAVVVVRGERRQADARSAMAAANVDLRATSAMLAQSTQLSERLRIARELHDQVGHQLTALSIELEVASHQSDGKGCQHVERARDTAKGLLGDVRAVVGDLRGPRTGLSEPLHSIVDGMLGVEVDLSVVEKVAVDEETSMAVIRCVQEVMTNALRHSGAQNLSIHIRTGPEGVTVFAEDEVREPSTSSKGMASRACASAWRAWAAS